MTQRISVWQSTSGVASKCALAILLVFLGSCARDVPPIYCLNDNFQCHIDQALKGITVVRQNIDYWSNVQTIGQIFIVFAGIVSTIVIALQGDDNRHWTRPLGLVSTTLVTGATSAMVAFHVPDNIDKLIDISGRMTEIVNKLDSDSSILMQGKTQQEWAQFYKENEDVRKQSNVILNEFTSSWSKSKIDMMRVSGSAARLNNPSNKANETDNKPSKNNP